MREITYLKQGNYKGLLRETLDMLPPDFGPLSRIKVFTSLDQTHALNTFVAGLDKPAPPNEQEMEHILKYAEELQAGKYLSDPLDEKPSPSFEREELIKYMKLCSNFHVETSNPRRFLKLKKLYEKVAGTEKVAVDIEVSRCSYANRFLTIKPYREYLFFHQRTVPTYHYYPSACIFCTGVL